MTGLFDAGVSLARLLVLAGGLGLLLVALASLPHILRRLKARHADADPLAEAVPTDEPAALVVEGNLLVRGDLALPTTALVRGSLRLASDASLDADVEVMGDLELGARASSSRPMVVHGDVRLCRDAVVRSTRVGGDVVLEPGARVEGTLRCNALYLREEETPQPMWTEIVTVADATASGEPP